MEFVVVKDISQGIERTKEFLYEEVDRKTVLFLSGGKTPKALYESLAVDKIITPAAVGLIDERYGEPFHANSNELMVQESGFLGYLKKQNIPFYSMLSQQLPHQTISSSAFHPKGGIGRHPGTDQENAVQVLAEQYDQITRDLFFKFPKNIGIIGIGDDGHIASIFPNRTYSASSGQAHVKGSGQADFKNPLFANNNTYEYVVGVDDPGKYGKRISLTFAGLSLLDFYIVFVFGKDKKKALQKALQPGPIEEIPARFFQQTEISEKTLFITDQKI